MGTILAGYKLEQKTFHSLLQPKCKKQILLFRGEKGCGKTTLLCRCCERIPTEVVHVRVQLRGSTVNVPEIFYRTGRLLTWANLSNFTEALARLEGTPKIQIDKNWIAGINNRINVILQQNQLDREYHQTILTDAWINDLGRYPKTVLFVFDTYEQATEDVKEWISGPFLARVELTPNLRVVVAGQHVPDDNNIEWGHSCFVHNLHGVSEARQWIPIVKAKGRRSKTKDLESWLVAVCDAFHGNPLKINQMIDTLPLEGVGI